MDIMLYCDMPHRHVLPYYEKITMHISRFTISQRHEKYEFIRKEIDFSDDKNRIDVLTHLLHVDDLDGFKIFFEELGFTDYGIQNNIIIKYSLQNSHCDDKCYEIAKYLLDQGVVPDDECIKLAYCRIFRGREFQTKLVKLFIEHGVNVRTDNEYILRSSCCEKYSKNQMDFIKFLIENGADIHAKDDFAFRISMYHRNYDLCEYLISTGANINTVNGSALRLAMSMFMDDEKNLIELLLKAGVDTKFFTAEDVMCCLRNDGLDNLELLAKNGFNIGIVNEMLLPYAKSKHVEFLDKYNINITGLTALLLAKKN